ncbi:hypothetical protein Spiaf_1125 [Spirochaeta africana DSM 8902]|uniref:Uncharacterized protein n=1 Tax=Spirochaeta africana (strain ATCC 700263 / DSM 8902 / Z-7692) TaxID=889378 RepID=H9UI68_SPIAZ|nr:hypothetical protein [Spirochaeta africana]AFG37211.1 hypothetical protein Spiaf_1125 [Spirochaeta africana DSM 8902]
MAHENDYTLLEQIVKILSRDDENRFARVIEKVVNEAMIDSVLKRSQFEK